MAAGIGWGRIFAPQTQRPMESKSRAAQELRTEEKLVSVGAEQILERVSEHFQSNLERLKQRSIRDDLARRCAITLCWDHAGLSHAEIAALFRMPSSNSVAQTIRRTKTQDAQTLKVLKHQISHK
jgi:hypothetical protein